jgi:hypothetical protein
VVITSQTTIGWQHFLFGRLLAEWSQAQRLHITTEDQNTDKYSGHVWTAKIITHLWWALLAHWEVRNKALHDMEVQASTKQAWMEPLIRHLYAHQLELPVPDQIMFQKPLEAQLQLQHNFNNPSTCSLCGSVGQTV